MRLVVVGGGAAGMTASIAAASEGARVVLLEKTGRLGLKLQISGGGRCNITNEMDDPRRLVTMFPGNGRFLTNAFHAWPKSGILEILRRRGVETKVEPPYGKVFPVSDKSTDVLDALSAEMRDLGVEVRLHAAVTGVTVKEGRAAEVRLPGGEALPCGAAILCPGGRSMPKSGSSGDGYEWARAVGHAVTELFPSLVPLVVDGVGHLAGVALRDVEGAVLLDGKLVETRAAGRPFRGDVLFTHSGLSGPVILQLSRAACEGLRRGASVEVRLDLKPDLAPDALDADVRRRFASRPASQLSTLLAEDMPKSAVPLFLSAAGLDGTRVLAQVTREERRRLVERLRAWAFPVRGWLSFDIAEVTAGGVDVREIDPKTFASRIMPGLYWAGEVLDVDGYMGGFNLQAAWSSGWLAGKAAAQYVTSRT